MKPPPPTYTWAQALIASPVHPMPEPKRLHQLTRMWSGLAAIETAADPTPVDWRVCADAVNLLETLVHMGHCHDASGLLPDASHALAQAALRLQPGAGHRSAAPGAIRLSGPGIHAVRAVLEDYAQALAHLPERTIIQAHRATERRIHQIQRGQGQAHDVRVVAL